MGALGGPFGPDAVRAKALAFYLPQYHPIPENDEWWGKGFTEWINVARARPLYPGHYQPHVPGELGYYDLRVPEVREAQADLARSHGLSGFVYYHYWFHGRRLLERPFDEVLTSGSPDFPFALCWANEEWTRNWDGQSGRLLIRQEYSEEDDRAHIRWLAEAFADHRYITIDGRPLFLVYRPLRLPDPKRTTDLWRTEAQKLGFPDLYLAWVEGWGNPPGGPEQFGFDATVGFMAPLTERVFPPVESMRGHHLLDYVASYERRLKEPAPEWKRFPSVMVGWDNTARRPRGATIFEGATPEAYRRWLEITVDSLAEVREEERFLFVVAWNEWAEGNHLEPDQRYGRAFLEATRSVLVVRDPSAASGPAGTVAATQSADQGAAAGSERSHFETAAANAVDLIREVQDRPERLVVNLGTHTETMAHEIGTTYRRLTLPTAAGAELDFARLAGATEELGDVGTLLLGDRLDTLAQPQRLLADLSAWALDHDEPLLVVSVPNATHFDVALSLLCGRWTEGPTDEAERRPLRFYSEETLDRLLSRCGWQRVAREDFRQVHSDVWDPELEDNIPEEMIGALRVLAATYNPQSVVQQFVWALTPVKIDSAPGSFADAVAAGTGEDERQLPRQQQHPVSNYLASVGIVASEINRRAVAIRRKPRPRWKRVIRDTVDASPPLTSAYNLLRRWLN